MNVGELKIDWVPAGQFWLDGGAMFGPVPKPMWEKKCPADAKNRIPLATNCILVEGPFGRALLDLGIGNKATEKFAGIIGYENQNQLMDSLAAKGLKPSDIDHVVMSHCDYDHLGGATWRNADGQVQPTFPKATYHIHQDEWDDLTHPNERAKGTYLRDNWEALERAGLVKRIERDGELLPGLSVFHTGGHTRGHVVIQLESQGEGAAYMGDLMPSRHHLNPLWVMAYDNYPLTSIEQRGAWTRKLAERGWWLLFYHDVVLGAGRWDFEGNQLDAVPVQQPVSVA